MIGLVILGVMDCISRRVVMYKVSESCQIDTLSDIYTKYFGYPSKGYFVEVVLMMVSLYLIHLALRIMDGKVFT